MCCQKPWNPTLCGVGHRDIQGVPMALPLRLITLRHSDTDWEFGCDRCPFQSSTIAVFAVKSFVYAWWKSGLAFAGARLWYLCALGCGEMVEAEIALGTLLRSWVWLQPQTHMEMPQHKKFPIVIFAGTAKLHWESGWRIQLSCGKYCVCAQLDFLSTASSPKEFEILLLQTQICLETWFFLWWFIRTVAVPQDCSEP